MTAASSIDGQKVPGEGDFSCCMNCGVLHVFAGDLTMREATRADLDNLDPQTAWDLSEVTAAILKNGRFKDSAGAFAPLERIPIKPRRPRGGS